MENLNSQPTGEQVEKVNPVVISDEKPSASETPAENKENDEEDLSEFGVPSLTEMLEAEENEEEDPTETTEKPVEKPATEVKPEEKPQEKPAEEIKEQPNQKVEILSQQQEQPKEYVPTSIDRRIMQLYTQAAVLQGQEAPTEADFVQALKDRSFQEKRQALNDWLARVNQLKGVQPQAISPDDLEIIAEAKAEEILKERELEAQRQQQEKQQEAWRQDIRDTIATHNELDENHKDFNPVITEAVTKMVQGGMLCSKAYEIVVGLSQQKKEVEEKEKAEKEKLEKQEALSGSVSASNDRQSKGEQMTWYEFDALRESDPDRYDKLNALRLKGKLTLLEDED